VSFAWPIALLGLILVPLALGAYLMVQRRRPKYAARFTNLDLLANVVEEMPGWRRHLPTALYLGALAALMFALAKPEMTISVPKEEATVILVTDVSGSMTATDIEPTRIGAAREAGHKLVADLPDGFRIGLIAFSTAPRVVVTPTDDKEVVDRALDNLQVAGGTAMGDAIMAAIESAQSLGEVPDVQAPNTPTTAPAGENGATTTKAPPAVIVLLSDGAQTVGQADPIEAAEVAKAAGIPVFTIALGTEDGVATVTDDRGRSRTIPVPPDEETLQEIADVTGARFFSAPSAGELETIYEQLGSQIGYDKESTEVTVWFAAAAAALVLAAGGLSLLWFNRFP